MLQCCIQCVAPSYQSIDYVKGAHERVVLASAIEAMKPCVKCCGQVILP